VKFEDLCGFMVEGNVDDVNVLNEVKERIREQGRVSWALEASNMVVCIKDLIFYVVVCIKDFMQIWRNF
jgi:hypothetical protein